ncbi:MAG TPA: adenylate cyclase [Candidatus Eisenbacteria bacterium]|nr:adenylate cyclase [Candidatus Eisenbacteria bacterium]
MERLVRKLVAIAACVVTLTLTTGISAGAIVTPTTGQPGAPNNTCGTLNPVTPGNAVSAPGSVFNPAGQSGTVYAGNPLTHSLIANSSAAVSQYDTACVRLSH